MDNSLAACCISCSIPQASCFTPCTTGARRVATPASAPRRGPDRLLRANGGTPLGQSGGDDALFPQDVGFQDPRREVYTRQRHSSGRPVGDQRRQHLFRAGHGLAENGVHQPWVGEREMQSAKGSGGHAPEYPAGP